MTPYATFLSRPQAAQLLSERKTKLVSEWENRCRQEVPAVRSFNKLALIHSVANFLDRLISALSSSDVNERDAEALEAAVGDALEKADLREYSLDQVLHEF